MYIIFKWLKRDKGFRQFPCVWGGNKTLEFKSKYIIEEEISFNHCQSHITYISERLSYTENCFKFMQQVSKKVHIFERRNKCFKLVILLISLYRKISDYFISWYCEASLIQCSLSYKIFNHLHYQYSVLALRNKSLVKTLSQFNQSSFVK